MKLPDKVALIDAGSGFGHAVYRHPYLISPSDTPNRGGQQ